MSPSRFMTYQDESSFMIKASFQDINVLSKRSWVLSALAWFRLKEFEQCQYQDERRTRQTSRPSGKGSLR